jgi:hypothetical protein
MRVKCMDASGSDFLVKDKEYDVLCSGKTTYILEGSPIRFKKERFVDVTRVDINENVDR